MSWAAVASSKMLDAAFWCGNPGAPAPPNCLPTSFANGGNNLRLGPMDAWVTSSDIVNDRLYYVCGGGHADWVGNQVISWGPVSGWVLERNASTTYPTAANGTYKYGAGEPASVHSYDSNVWMPTKNRIWRGGGIFWSSGGDSVPEVAWWYDYTGQTFTEKATRRGGYGIASGWDSVGNRLLYRSVNEFVSYNPDLEDGGPNPNAYTALFTQSGSAVESSPLAINAPQRLVYRIDRRTSGNPGGGLKMINLNNLQAKEVLLATVGDTQIETYASAGLLYRDNRLVGLGPSSVAGRWAVYTAIVDGRGLPGQPAVQWVRDPVDANEPVAPASNAYRGIWKKFNGPFSDGKYYVAALADQNVTQYTPTWTATTHTVDEVADLLIEVL